VTPIESGSGDAFAPDDARIPELVSRAVPFPLSPSPGRRVRVRLLNGTPDADLTPAAARQLVEAGAEITIAGNAATFDVSETTFAYESSEQRDEAEQLADAFGVGSVEEGGGASESPSATAAAAEDEIDVTIVLGSDAQDLIGRLENAG
jgi:LytR cell envelope-related transcriptional attenuator